MYCVIFFMFFICSVRWYFLTLCHYFAQAMFWLLHSCICVHGEVCWSRCSVMKHMRMLLLYARSSISYSMYIHILLCLGGCRTLCVTMYVASPLNLLRLLPFILNTLCQNKSGISSEPSCWYGKELKEVIFTEHQVCVAKSWAWAILIAKSTLTTLNLLAAMAKNWKN